MDTLAALAFRLAHAMSDKKGETGQFSSLCYQCENKIMKTEHTPISTSVGKFLLPYTVLSPGCFIRSYRFYIGFAPFS